MKTSVTNTILFDFVETFRNEIDLEIDFEEFVTKEEYFVYIQYNKDYYINEDILFVNSLVRKLTEKQFQFLIHTMLFEKDQ